MLEPDRIAAIERTVKHDVIAFLTHVEELAGSEARWLHRGMTSSDVLDSSLAVLLVRAADLLLTRLDALVDALARRADEHRKTPMIGRSHGMHAEPTTFGVALAGHLAEMKRGRARLRVARVEVAVGKIAGAVGTYAHLSPAIEARALSALGLAPETVATQIVPRDRHAAFFTALAVVAAGVERLATNVRHWQRTEVAEAEERFTQGQKGSSAMPHKRNPIVSENLCGLARIVRAAALPALEDVALWHERDISHSSVERMIAPDATTTLGYMLERAAALVSGLVIYPEGLRRNLDRSGELYFSEAVLLSLVQHGRPRQAAYAIVQRCAMAALAGEGRFRDLLGADAEAHPRSSPRARSTAASTSATLSPTPTPSSIARSRRPERDRGDGRDHRIGALNWAAPPARPSGIGSWGRPWPRALGAALGWLPRSTLAAGERWRSPACRARRSPARALAARLRGRQRRRSQRRLALGPKWLGTGLALGVVAGVGVAVAGILVAEAGAGVAAEARSASRCHGYLMRPWYMLTSVEARREVITRRSSRVRPDSSSWPALSLVKMMRWIISSNFLSSGGKMVRLAASIESTSMRMAVSLVCGFIPG